MDTIIGDCPLGAKCEEVKTVNEKQVMVRCPWFIAMRGRDGNKDQQLDESRCAIAWMPTLQANMIGEVRGSTTAVESLRNEVLRDNEKTRKLMAPPQLKSIGDKS